MTITSKGFAPCEKGTRYVQQLVKHWAHKFETDYTDGRGQVPFSETVHAVFDADENGISILLTAPDQADTDRMRGVIEHHLDRFSFREAPLSYTWDVA